MQKRNVYLDHNATTAVSAPAFEAMKPLFSDIFGNASSVHTYGQKARKHLEDARATVARLLNAAKPEEIIFTGCGTESDNLAIKGTAWANKEKGNHIITSSIEHHAVLYTCQFLEKQGFEVTYLPVDKYGRVNPADVQKALRPETILVTIMHANNEVGTIQPIKEIGILLREENEKRFKEGKHRVVFHTDAVQTAGKLPIDVQELGVDLLAISGHKFYGPKGVGALYVKKGTRLQPVMHGGHHERNLRPGTENIAGIAGMAKALETALADHETEQARLAALRDRFEQGVLKAIPSVKVNGHPEARMAGTANISFECIEGEGLLLSLDLEGIAASTGSACASGSLESSHVLNAMGVDPATAQGTLRFSFGHENTVEDVDYVLSVMPRMVERLRSMSPLWGKK